MSLDKIETPLVVLNQYRFYLHLNDLQEMNHWISNLRKFTRITTCSLDQKSNRPDAMMDLCRHIWQHIGSTSDLTIYLLMVEVSSTEVLFKIKSQKYTQLQHIFIAKTELVMRFFQSAIGHCRVILVPTIRSLLLVAFFRMETLLIILSSCLRDSTPPWLLTNCWMLLWFCHDRS